MTQLPSLTPLGLPNLAGRPIDRASKWLRGLGGTKAGPGLGLDGSRLVEVVADIVNEELVCWHGEVDCSPDLHSDLFLHLASSASRSFARTVMERASFFKPFVNQGPMRLQGSWEASPWNLQVGSLDASKCEQLVELRPISHYPNGPITIRLSGCHSLQKLPEGLDAEDLLLDDCTALETLPHRFRAWCLDLRGCVAWDGVVPPGADVKIICTDLHPEGICLAAYRNTLEAQRANMRAMAIALLMSGTTPRDVVAHVAYEQGAADAGVAAGAVVDILRKGGSSWVEVAKQVGTASQLAPPVDALSMAVAFFASGENAKHAIEAMVTTMGDLPTEVCGAMEGLCVLGDLDFGRKACWGLTRLPAGFRVGGKLNCSGNANLVALPPGLHVEGDLHVCGCETLSKLSDGLVIGGDFRAMNCPALIRLPHRLKVAGDIDLRGCPWNGHMPHDAECMGRIFCDMFPQGVAMLVFRPPKVQFKPHEFRIGCVPLTEWSVAIFNQAMAYRDVSPMDRALAMFPPQHDAVVWVLAMVAHWAFGGRMVPLDDSPRVFPDDSRYALQFHGKTAVCVDVDATQPIRCDPNSPRWSNPDIMTAAMVLEHVATAWLGYYLSDIRDALRGEHTVPGTLPGLARD